MSKSIVIGHGTAQKVIIGATGISEKFPIIAGPCLVESREVLQEVAEELVRLEIIFPISFVFKSSYRKANRTSGRSFTGLGDDAALSLLSEIRTKYSFPILTDIHEPSEAALAAKVADVLQIPAFLARQSSLLEAAAKTGRVVNIKKGQFMAPEDMQFARDKVIESGNGQVLLTERGTFFGYGDLVVDFRSLEIMRSFGSPIIYDATHSVQRPSQGGMSGGERKFIRPLLRAAMAVGVDGLFLETHPNPSEALSDKGTQIPLQQLASILEEALSVREGYLKSQNATK